MLDTLKNIVKVTALLALGGILMVAINTLLSFLTPFVVPPVFIEALALISMYLPFNASAVFSIIGLVLEAILIFMIANKIFNLNTWLIKDA